MEEDEGEKSTGRELGFLSVVINILVGKIAYCRPIYVIDQSKK